MIPFAAVLLAGGQSRRMGRDKALLPLADGRLLWQRQLDVLRELQSAELFISGPARDGFPPDVPLLTDAAPGLGPLAGIAAALTAMRSPLLVVLAVDMPGMTAVFLHRLLDRCSDDRGIVPQHPESGFYEPLAAVHHRSVLSLATARLQESDRSLQSFVRTASTHLDVWIISAEDRERFANWNEPLSRDGEINGTKPAA